MFEPKILVPCDTPGVTGARLSQADLDQRACRPQILFIWGPCNALVLVALLGQAKILKTAGAWCAPVSTPTLLKISGRKYPKF